MTSRAAGNPDSPGNSDDGPRASTTSTIPKENNHVTHIASRGRRARRQGRAPAPGESGSETDYGSPLEAARTWVEAGAEWIHLVDLDAAFGTGNNRAQLREIVHELGDKVNIEMSGGVRDDDSLSAALEAGAARVNIGTAALENPEWTARSSSVRRPRRHRT